MRTSPVWVFEYCHRHSFEKFSPNRQLQVTFAVNITTPSLPKFVARSKTGCMSYGMLNRSHTGGNVDVNDGNYYTY